jgi:O-antigen/teichoic acid export membrane protein
LSTTSFVAKVRTLAGGREGWAIADQALVSATNFLTNVIVARNLGLVAFGVFSIAWMALLFINSMQMASIIAPMMSLAPKTQARERPGYFGSLVIQEIALVSVSMMVLLGGLRLISIWTHQPGLKSLQFPLCLAIAMYLMQDFIRRYLFTTKQSRRAFIEDAVSCLPQLPLIYILTRLHKVNVPGVLYIVASTSALGIMLGIYWLEPITFSRNAFKATTLRQWKISKWLTPSALLTWTGSNFFVVIAPAYYGAVAAGVLRASQNMVAVANIWFLGLDNVMPSEAARRLHEHGRPSAVEYLRGMFWKWGSITLAFIGVLCVVPGFWLNLIYGTKFAGYGYLLRLFGLLYLVIFTGKIANAGLQALEFTAPIFWLNLIMTVLSLIVAIPLTKRFGLTGVMIGSLGSQIFMQGMLIMALYLRLRHLSRAERLMKMTSR